MSTPSGLSQAAKCYCFDRKVSGQVLVYLLAKKANLLAMTPTQLALAAKCYCFDDDRQKRVVAYLLEAISGLNQTPTQLQAAAKCFCFDEATQRSVVSYLLDAIANGGGTCPQDMQVAWTPTNVKLGEVIGFFAFGGVPGITSITFTQSTSLSGFDIENAPTLTSLSWPNLASIDPLATEGGYFTVASCSALVSISLPLLVSTAGQFQINGNNALAAISLPLFSSSSQMAVFNNTALTSFSAPSLTTIGTDSPQVDFHGNTSLSIVTLTNYVPTNGINQNFATCALSAASVNHVLARCVANAAYVSGTVDLSGGTNAAPSGQGIADKATLIGRGVIVNTN